MFLCILFAYFMHISCSSNFKQLKSADFSRFLKKNTTNGDVVLCSFFSDHNRTIKGKARIVVITIPGLMFPQKMTYSASITSNNPVLIFPLYYTMSSGRFKCNLGRFSFQAILSPHDWMQSSLCGPVRKYAWPIKKIAVCMCFKCDVL